MSIISTLSVVLALGAALPPSDAIDTHGKAVKLSDLTATGPVYVYFVNRDCPHSWIANPFMDALATTYGKRLFVGVINTDAKNYADYAKRFPEKYRILLDPKLNLIHRYKVKSSPTVIKLNVDGKVTKVWEGISVTMYNEISRDMAETSGMPPKALPTEGLPNYRQAGCSF
ncbi:redoxin domain-containing protein [bacterium]|nr:MAG: redoxin domain-containing protein [bacterium]